jgi:hypothetical protein
MDGSRYAALRRSLARRREAAAGAAVGLALGLVALAPGFVAGTGGLWACPPNDVVMYRVAWSYYVADAWRWPLFEVPALGYPEGGSVLFMDALPLAALATKLFASLTGVRVNPFGGWMLLAYVLQGALAARCVAAAGARSLAATVAAATFAICCASFLDRLAWEHLALSSHFVILWALALYLESARRPRLTALEWFCAAAVALLVNSYLFAMVVALAGATALALLGRGRLGARELAQAALGGAGLVALGVAAGYGVMFTNPAQMKAPGFGEFSWNLVALLVPPDGVFGLLGGIPRDATTGQYEGEAWIGYGALLLLGGGVLVSPRAALRAVRRHAWLCAVLGLLAVYAASNRVYLGRRLVLAYDLPSFVAELCSYFRASGRFIWPAAYALALGSVALASRTWRREAALGLALLAAALQVATAWPVLRNLRAQTATAHPDLLEPGVEEWIARHERLWLYPSWSCGSIGGPGRPWHGLEENWDLQLQLAASAANVPINSVYAARPRKDCAAEAEWGRRPSFEPGVLYVLGGAAVKEPALAALVRAGRCLRLSGGVVCSTDASFPAPVPGS